MVDIKTISNLSAQKMGGAGITAAQEVVKEKVEAIITGNIGPRALDVFNQFNIKTYKGIGLIKDILQKFIDGKLEKFWGD